MIQDPNLEMMRVMLGVIRNIEYQNSESQDLMPSTSVSDDSGLFKYSALIIVKFQCD